MATTVDLELIERATSVLQISKEAGIESTDKLAASGSSTIKFHQFGTQVLDTTYFFQVTNFGNSIYLWIGDGSGKMDDLAMSSVTPYDKKGMPTTTKILGSSGDNLSESFAGKLTKRLKKPVYVSFNVDVGAMYTTILQDIEQRLYEEITLCPDKF
ncbi:Proteasome assembly chaperone 4 [Orchesella cincta]|uniref:Proteasome assembly chaperone 4 n=1 Tax=Orchesella cincta TaxID=48709 RepID=A0A1D2NHP6_ORCCI|nr:Proteasome assembly chaperone 4 [Orchesella cincta]